MPLYNIWNTTGYISQGKFDLLRIVLTFRKLSITYNQYSVIDIAEKVDDLSSHIGKP
jgi:hypothetical protein